MNFLTPTLLMIFAAFFLATSRALPGRSHLIFFACGYFLCGLGFLTKIVGVPPDNGLNIIQSSSLYIGSALCFIEGLARRSKMSLPGAFHVITFISIMAAVWYFYYIDRNIAVRVFVLSS